MRSALAIDASTTEALLRWQQPIFLIDTLNAGLDAFPEGLIHDALIEARDFVLSKEGKD